MRPSRTRWRRAHDRARRATRALRAAALLVPLGCVSQGDYDSVRQERDLLREERDRLATGQSSLDSERVKLLDQIEDLRNERDTLKKKVDQLSRRESELEHQTAGFGQCTAENETLKTTYQDLVRDLETELSANQIELDRLRSDCKPAVKKKPAGAKPAPKPASKPTAKPAAPAPAP